MTRVVVTAAAFSPEQELAGFGGDDSAGALASFVGFCRNASSGGPVERLELECYPGFTERVLEDMARSIARRHGLIDLLLVHRVGPIAVGEAIVLVAALSAHRFAALTAVGELMDFLKTEAPIWKREVGAHGSTWIEPTDQDRRAAAMWRAPLEETRTP